MGIEVRFVDPKDPNAFAEATDDEGLISREMFDECFVQIQDEVSEQLDEDDEDKLHLVLGRLYDIFDTDDDGVVDFTELSTGLSVLCGGNRDEKAAAAAVQGEHGA